MNNYISGTLKIPFIKTLLPYQKIKGFFFSLFKGSLIETIVVTAIVTIAAFFVPSIATIIPIALLIIGNNFFLRAISLIFKESTLPFKNAIIIVIHFFMAAQFAYLFNTIIITLIHEMGHAIAAYAMYINPDPNIQIFPFSGGETSYATHQLGAIGKFLGTKVANTIIAAAGSVMTMLFSFLMLFIAKKRLQTSELYTFLTTSAIYGIASDALYAHSALEGASSSHDFVGLWDFGVHPLLSVSILLLTPILFKLCFLRLKKA